MENESGLATGLPAQQGPHQPAAATTVETPVPAVSLSGGRGNNNAGQGRTRSPTRLTFTSSTLQDGPSEARRKDAEPRFDRVLKTFKIEVFNGSAQHGVIDTGVATWIRKFEALLGMQEDLHRIRLPDSMKNALLFQHLGGAASQWYVANLYDLRDRSFESTSRALKKEFGCKLSKAQISQMVAAERKNPAETYREYSLRLRAMATATTVDGVETCDSNNLALSSFITNAWFKHSDNLKMVIREDSSHPLHEMDRTISRLCTIAGHQGIMQSQFHQGNGSTSAASSFTGKRKSTNGSVQRDGKYKKRDFSTARCNVCKQLGHTTLFYDRFVARQQIGMANVAQSGEENSNSQSEPPQAAEEESSENNIQSFD